MDFQDKNLQQSHYFKKRKKEKNKLINLKNIYIYIYMEIFNAFH